MASFGFVAMRRAIDVLLGFLLTDAFSAVRSPPDIFWVFCALPDLSKIGVITVIAIIASVFAHLFRSLARVWRASRAGAARTDLSRHERPGLEAADQG